MSLVVPAQDDSEAVKVLGWESLCESLLSNSGHVFPGAMDPHL